MRISYLMSPYTHKDPRVMQGRYEKAVEVVYALTTKNHLIFSPIMYCHPIAEMCDVARNYDFWRPFNRAMILISDASIVLQLKNWHESTGILHEMNLFRATNKHICYVTLKELGLEEE